MKNILDNLRKIKCANLILFLIFTATIYLQCIFFNNSLGFIKGENEGYKIAIAMLIASPIFLFRGKSWIIWVSILINAWGISNLVYYRANGVLIDAYSVTMIGNMNGFWASVPFYIKASDFLAYYTTLIVVLFYILFKNNRRQIWATFIAVILSIVVHVISCKTANEKSELYNPFSISDASFGRWNMHNKAIYAQGTSIIHHLIYETHYYFRKIVFKSSSYELSEKDEQDICRFVTKGEETPKPTRPVFIILLESFETCVLRPDIMPNLYEFVQGKNILCAKRIKTQTKKGTSADGQMIVNTGLLPTKEGAACFRFPDNIYPAISNLYDKTFNIIPGGRTVWNQLYMNKAYGINDGLDASWDDKKLFDMFMENYSKYNYGMLLTMATHTPFDMFAKRSSLVTPEDMPIHFANYLKSFNYADSCLKPLLDAIKEDEYLKNAVVVFTGDHSIFYQSRRDLFVRYCRENNLPYNVEENYSSFIMYSPDIEENIIIEEPAYQMDIYPTILNAIGCEKYYWGGFGVNLLEENALKERKISEEEAFELSDKIHQSNYFKVLFQ